MKRPILNLDDYQSLVPEYHGESDRSAVIMASSFAEHLLATYIRFFLVDDDEVECLFSTGPLRSFDSRINIAYGFRLINKTVRDELRLIKSIRNRFAHAPRQVTLQREDIREDIKKLRMWATLHSNPDPDPEVEKRIQKDERHVYLYTVGQFMLFVHRTIGNTKPSAAAPEQK